MEIGNAGWWTSAPMNAESECGEMDVLAVIDGFRENADSWRYLLLSLGTRRLAPSDLAIGDGALGFWAAFTKEFELMMSAKGKWRRISEPNRLPEGFERYCSGTGSIRSKPPPDRVRHQHLYISPLGAKGIIPASCAVVCLSTAVG